MLLRVFLKERFAFKRSLEVGFWDLSFFSERVGEDHSGLAMKKVQKPVLNATHMPAQFVETTAKILGIGPAQVVPMFFEKGDPSVGYLEVLCL